MICEENCDERNADGHLGQVSGNPIRDDLAADGSQSRRVGRSPPDAMSGSRSLRPVVELWDVERPCPLLAAPREHLEFRRKPLFEAIESAFLYPNDARGVLPLLLYPT